MQSSDAYGSQRLRLGRRRRLKLPWFSLLMDPFLYTKRRLAIKNLNVSHNILSEAFHLLDHAHSTIIDFTKAHDLAHSTIEKFWLLESQIVAHSQALDTVAAEIIGQKLVRAHVLENWTDEIYAYCGQNVARKLRAECRRMVMVTERWMEEQMCSVAIQRRLEEKARRDLAWSRSAETQSTNQTL